VIRHPAAAWTAAAATLALLAADIVRRLQLGVADTGLAFFAFATCAGVFAALAVARWQPRMAVLILAWLLLGVADDLGVDWPTSRPASTLWMLGTGLLPATYALMVLAYPAGRLRDRLERAFVAATYLVGIAWMSVPCCSAIRAAARTARRASRH
jgi:hypothetical protein